eukprot:5521780-Pyramimonas_sp.AAC.1
MRSYSMSFGHRSPWAIWLPDLCSQIRFLHARIRNLEYKCDAECSLCHLISSTYAAIRATATGRLVETPIVDIHRNHPGLLPRENDWEVAVASDEKFE